MTKPEPKTDKARRAFRKEIWEYMRRRSICAGGQYFLNAEEIASALGYEIQLIHENLQFMFSFAPKMQHVPVGKYCVPEDAGSMRLTNKVRKVA